MKKQTTKIPVCVRCGNEVRLVAGAKPERHEGHVSPAKDRTCGTWGFRLVAAIEEA